MAYLFDPTKRNVYEQVEKNTADISDLRNIVDGIDVQSSWISSEDYTTQQAYYDLTKITGAIQDVKVGEHVYFVASEIDAIISWIGNNEYQVSNATSRKGETGEGIPALMIAKAFSGTYIPNPPKNAQFTVQQSECNRTPQVGDIATVMYQQNTGAVNYITYLVQVKITNIIQDNNSYLLTVAILYRSDALTGNQGEQGVGISSFENVGTSQGQGFTITHCEATLTDGTKKNFDIQAENGQDGAAKYINITEVPETATQGALTSAQLATLNEAPNINFIMFYGEKFIPMDVQDSRGYRVYTHHGETNETKIETSKFIYLTLSTGAWVMNVNTAGQYCVTIGGSPLNAICCFICYVPKRLATKTDFIQYLINRSAPLIANGVVKINGNISGNIVYIAASGSTKWNIHSDYAGDWLLPLTVTQLNVSDFEGNNYSYTCEPIK